MNLGQEELVALSTMEVKSSEGCETSHVATGRLKSEDPAPFDGGSRRQKIKDVGPSQAKYGSANSQV